MEQRRNQVEPAADHYHHNNNHSKVSHNNLINNQLNGASHHYAPKIQNGNSVAYLVDSAQQHLNSLSLNNSHHPLNNQQAHHHPLNNKQAGNVFSNGQQSVYAQQKEAHSAQILHQKLPTKQQEANIYQMQQQHQQHQDYINPQKVAQYVNSSQQLLHQQRQHQQQHQLIGQQPVQYNQFNGNNNHHFVAQQPQQHQQQQQQQLQQSNIGYVQQKQPNDWPATEKQNRLFRAM